MPSALELHSALRAFMDGNDPGPEFRAGPHDINPATNKPYKHRYADNIVGYSSGGSKNWGPMSAANDLVYRYNRRDWGRVNQTLDYWAEYAKLRWQQGEVYCCNIYTPWIYIGIMTAATVARLVGRDDLAHSLYRHLRTCRVLSALSAGWRKLPNSAGFHGYPVMMCGARSWSDPRKYMLTGDTFAADLLAFATGVATPESKHMVARIRAWCGFPNVDGITAEERDTLVEVMRNRVTSERLALCIRWLREGPGLAADAAIIRTDEMVAWVNLSTINCGSTSYMMGKAWYAKERPARFNSHKWQMPKEYGWLTVDPPRRSWGATCAGEILPGYAGFRAQRITVHKKRKGEYEPFSYFDEMRPEGRQNVAGWRKLEFRGQLMLDLRVGRTGVQLLHPDGSVEPPPPPGDGTPGWHTIRTEPAYLKFTNAAAQEAIQTLTGGDNHIEVSQVALLRPQAQQVLGDLKKIGG